MGHAAQTRLNAADDDGHIGIKLAQTAAVHDGRTLRTVSRLSARRIGIVMADFARSCVLVQHRIHVPCRNKKPQPGLAQAVKIPGCVPVRLGNDADLIAMCLEHAADDRGAEAGMIDVSITGDKDEIQLLPAAFLHILPADW